MQLLISQKVCLNRFQDDILDENVDSTALAKNAKLSVKNYQTGILLDDLLRHFKISYFEGEMEFTSITQDHFRIQCDHFDKMVREFFCYSLISYMSIEILIKVSKRLYNNPFKFKLILLKQQYYQLLFTNFALDPSKITSAEISIGKLFISALCTYECI